MPGHVALDGVAATAIRTGERLVIGERALRISIPHTVRVVIRYRHRWILAEVSVAVLSVERL